MANTAATHSGESDEWCVKSPSQILRRPWKRRTIISHGVACVRRGVDGLEILLVKKRVSYAFNTFIHGHYRSDNSAEMIGLFSGMTNDEKHDILSLNFSYVWYRAWLDTAQSSAMYHAMKQKYENTFLHDNGAKLRRLMKLSRTSHRMWEIPKGRKKSSTESEVHCAIREFAEETGVPKSKYKITPTIKQYRYVDDGVEYVNKYVIATATAPISLVVNLDNRDQSGEISEVRWMSMRDIIMIDNVGSLTRITRGIFDYIRKNKLI